MNSRRPDNTRVRLPAIDTKVWIQCRGCLGDGWCDHHTIFWRRQRVCGTCRGAKAQQILLIERRTSDIVVPAPAGRAGAA